MTNATLKTPWTLHFDRDGTEDIAIIRDAHDEELVRSRPFWLPGNNDPVPPTLAAVRAMKAAPKLYRALTYLLEQTVDQDLKYGITLTEGEETARTQAQAALAEANGENPEPGKHFRVEVVVRTREVYRVTAETAEEAEKEWWDGQLIETDDNLENDILSIEEIQP
jgi:hypothetical protein